MRKLLITLTFVVFCCSLFVQAGVEAKSAIEWNQSSFIEFGDFTILGSAGNEKHIYRLTYPRTKKLNNGDLLMLFQDGQQSWDILYMRSPDAGKTWSKPQFLAEQQPVPGDTRAFATADMVQLTNGWLVVAYAFRYSADFKRSNVNSGIEVRISKDNGYTWGEPIIAYRGANWEPSLLQLPSGELQLYYTERGPYHDSVQTDPRFSVDVGLLRSFDNGYTWTPKVDGPPWKGERLSQNEGQDGMAVATVLNNAQGIAYVCESWHASNTGPWVVWSSMDANWRYPEMQNQFNAKGEPNYGPWDRRWVVHKDFHGWAPYMVRTESGETIVASNGSFKGGPSRFSVFVGDDQAKNFADPSIPFPMAPGGWWGSLAIKDQNTILAASTLTKGPDTFNGWDDIKHVLYTEGHFLRDFKVPFSNNITLDGKLEEAVWDSESYLFMGSESQAHSYVKAADDGQNLYLGIETLDENLWRNPQDPMSGDSISVYIDADNSKANTIGKGIYRVDIAPDYVALMRTDGSGSWRDMDETSAQVVYHTNGTFNENTKNDVGYTAEFAIPWDVLGGRAAADNFGITVVLHNNDDGGKVPDTHDIVADTNVNKPAGWFTLTLTASLETAVKVATDQSKGQIRDFRFLSDQAATYSGMVQHVRTGAGIPGVRVWLKDAYGNTAASDITDTAGRFTLVALPGTGVLTVDDPRVGIGDDDWFVVSEVAPKNHKELPGATEFLNIAQLASVKTSSTQVGYSAQALIDGKLLQDQPGGWLSNGEGTGAWVRLDWQEPQRARSLLIYNSIQKKRQVRTGMVRFGHGATGQPVAVEKVTLSAESGIPAIVPIPEDQDITWLEFVVDEVEAGGTAGLQELAVAGYPSGHVWLSSPERRAVLSGITPIRIEAPGVTLCSIEVQLDGKLLYKGVTLGDLNLKPAELAAGYHIVALTAIDAMGRLYKHAVQFQVEHLSLAEPSKGLHGKLDVAVKPAIPGDQLTEMVMVLLPTVDPFQSTGPTTVGGTSGAGMVGAGVGAAAGIGTGDGDGDGTGRVGVGNVPLQYIAFGGKPIPTQFTFNTLTLPDGSYDLIAEATTISGVKSKQTKRIIIDNYDIVDDPIKAPQAMGWFGVVESMLTVNKSSGWEHVSEDPATFFGDADRLRKESGTEEYLTWSLHSIRNFNISLYAQDPQLQRQIRVQISADGEEWTDIPYSATVPNNTIASGPQKWMKVGVNGEVPDNLPASYFRLVFLGGDAGSAQLQLGHVRLAALK